MANKNGGKRKLKRKPNPEMPYGWKAPKVRRSGRGESEKGKLKRKTNPKKPLGGFLTGSGTKGADMKIKVTNPNPGGKNKWFPRERVKAEMRRSGTGLVASARRLYNAGVPGGTKAARVGTGTRRLESQLSPKRRTGTVSLRK